MAHCLRARSLWLIGALAVIGVVAVASDDKSVRESIAAKMYCNCGCGEMLSECTHVQCKRKVAVKREIADALSKGDSDLTVLQEMGAKYGATILATPPFLGFNILLWVWPFGVAAVAIVILLVRLRKGRTVQRIQG